MILMKLCHQPTTMLNGQDLPDDDLLQQMTLEELEKELVRLSREYEDLLADGKISQARDLEESIRELEDTISDLESN